MGSPTTRFRQNTRHNAKGRGEFCFAKSSLRQLLTITAVDSQCDGSSPVNHSISQMSSSFVEFWPKQLRPIGEKVLQPSTLSRPKIADKDVRGLR